MQGAPTMALPHPQATPSYEVDWRQSSIISSVCQRKEVEDFCRDLEENEIRPIIEDLKKWQAKMLIIFGVLCILLLCIGIVIYSVYGGNQAMEKARAVH
jgi:hypothetical protein